MWGGVDPREHGSGSMGTTNVLRTVGKKAAGVGVSVGFRQGGIRDRVNVATRAGIAFIAGYGGDVCDCWAHVAGCSLVSKGGKGIATGWGAILILSPISAVLTLIGLAIALLTRYVSLGSMIGASLGVGGLVVSIGS